MRVNIKVLLQVDFEGKALDFRLDTLIATITLTLDAHRYHIDSKPTMMDITGGSGP